MKLIFVKVLPILLLVLVGAQGTVLKDSISDNSSSSLAHELNQIQQSPTNLSENERIIPKLYTSCVEALQNGADSGIYTLLLPFSGLDPFDVYCLRDPENGPAWTVVQRRQDGSVDFYRSLTEYQRGFGNLNGEFFLGLQYLYALTNQLKPQQLWIQLADWEGATKAAKYSSFQIGPESSMYNMTQLGVYSGNAGDSLTYHLGSPFSAKGSISDSFCAQQFKGAWWFKNCLYSDLNGEYLRGENIYKNGTGIRWYDWRGEYSHKYSHMALRPSN